MKRLGFRQAHRSRSLVWHILSRCREYPCDDTPFDPRRTRSWTPVECFVEACLQSNTCWSLLLALRLIASEHHVFAYRGLVNSAD
ncbi:hypothetical protein PMIN05_012638 [Paraphaeosphaeria minitans]